MTDDPPDTVLADLIAREPIFHRPEWGTRRADYDAMMAPEFWEIGASGTTYSREAVLEILEQRQMADIEEVWETRDFTVQNLSKDLYLLSYILLQDGVRLSRRTTLWQWSGERWLIRFHQGTLIVRP